MKTLKMQFKRIQLKRLIQSRLFQRKFLELRELNQHSQEVAPKKLPINKENILPKTILIKYLGYPQQLQKQVLKHIYPS